MVAPQDSSIVSGQVSLEASAFDSIGVQKVEFLVDGVLSDSGILSGANYTSTWNTAGLAEHSEHTISARASDLSGNIGYSDTVYVTVGVRDIDILHSSFTVGAHQYRYVPFTAAAGDSVLGDFRVLNSARLPDFFWCDAANLSLFQQGQAFTAFDRQQNAANGTVANQAGGAGQYYLVFNNTATASRSIWARFLLRKR